MDLGAQYVYPESLGCIYDLEWPHILMEHQYSVWKNTIKYDSSGLQMYDDKGRDIDKFLQVPDIKILCDSNSETSVGQYIETA